MSCLFCRIVSGELSSDKIYEDEHCYAFRDNNPKANIHYLIVPKNHIRGINEAQTKDLVRLLNGAKAIAKQEGFFDYGYKLQFNAQAGGGQEVFHLHLHLLSTFK